MISLREKKSRLYQIIQSYLNNVGMNTFHNRYDAIENLIFKEGLRIENLEITPDLNKIIIHLNNEILFVAPIALYKGLRNASVQSLNNYKFIGNGTGIHWPDLDEDLSLKGFCKSIYGRASSKRSW